MSLWTELTPALNAQVQRVFADPVLYRQSERPPFTINGHFDEAYESVDLEAGVPVSSFQSILDVVLSDFSVPPKQGDEVTIGTGITARKYLVSDPQPDGDGGARLLLLKRE